MGYQLKFQLWTAALLAPAIVSACGGQSSGPVADDGAASACVEIPDGYYLFTEGQFSPTSEDMAIELPAQTTQSQVAWVDSVTDDVKNMGYDWLSVSVAGPVATLVGTAPDADTKQAAYSAGRNAVMSSPVGAQHISLVVDGISVDGGEQAVGGALAGLADRPTPEACQATFAAVMTGRNIEFDSDNSSIAESSARLLDAVTGAALICSDYTIEIGVHTDARGADSYNLRLSQERADAVKQYLVDNGVTESKLTAVGYGESRPLDYAQTSEAYARNRRIEFTLQGY
ncbi:OmpA family protein [Henriciella sp. AS95]|uniref:OmpA family protein n=1 Tax=Henriciella sp. AS95 TaxID=3135782 RepID=UPI003179931E